MIPGLSAVEVAEQRTSHVGHSLGTGAAHACRSLECVLSSLVLMKLLNMLVTVMVDAAERSFSVNFRRSRSRRAVSAVGHVRRSPFVGDVLVRTLLV